MLGPLEIEGDLGPVALHGIKRRATLGFLLMHPNRAVATSRLLQALWPAEEAPATARKVLQNAIWGLRGTLNSADTSGSTSLRTRAPGYMLTVDPLRVDLYRFQEMVADGQTKLAGGEVEAAARVLGEALTLWEGPALADLQEAGIVWPELTAVQGARLDAMEVYFEAQLECGRHRAVLAEIEAMVESEPLRERACGQLMLALYRCGRQADALAVYSRVRTALVTDLGLEPDRSLQALQQAILQHDPALALPSGPITVSAATVGAAIDHTSPIVPRPRRGDAEHRELTVLLVRPQLAPALDDAGPEEVDEAIEATATIIKETVESFGGVVTSSMGLEWLALFGLEDGDGEAERAVRAALAIRDRVGGPGVSTIKAAISTGRALVRHRGGRHSSPAITGSLLDRCQELLLRVPPGEIWVCDNSYAATRDAVSFGRADPAQGWKVRSAGHASAGRRQGPVADREHEFDVLRCVLDRVCHRAVPHLVTVLANPGAGKTRFVMELERRVAARPEGVHVIAGHVPPPSPDRPHATLTDVLDTLRGMPDDLSQMRARRSRLTVAGRHSGRAGSPERRPLALLQPPVAASENCCDLSGAVRKVMTKAAKAGPLVLVIDDLHYADDCFLNFVDGLVDSASAVPLLLVATSRLELLHRRPAWAGGKRHATTITLDQDRPAEMSRLRLVAGA